MTSARLTWRPNSVHRRRCTGWIRAGLWLGFFGLGLGPGLILSLVQAQPVGDAQRGRALLMQRHETGCILCHTVPGLATGGEIGPPLSGLAGRYQADELRARIADARQFNPQTVMPPYRSTQGLQHVAPAFQGKPVLTEQALEDIVSYLLAEQRPPHGNPPTRNSDGSRQPSSP